MKYDSLKRLDRTECGFLLGSNYITAAAQALKVDKKQLIRELVEHINNGSNDSEKSAFNNFLTELIALTFILYKWGLLLFHIENGIFSNMIVSVKVDDDFTIATENDGKFTVISIDDRRVIFAAKEGSKSAIALFLLWLQDKIADIELLECVDDDPILDGNRISFNRERFEAQQLQIAFIKSQFAIYKKRLEELQQLFTDHIFLENCSV
ncbi:MAG: hypothetical protein LBE89_05565 [Helicobacteraceae bacterium]|jgi:hypothetical protein|nr:hypothetical protein [Helicobacteraceae bacterium]